MAPAAGRPGETRKDIGMMHPENGSRSWMILLLLLSAWLPAGAQQGASRRAEAPTVLVIGGGGRQEVRACPDDGVLAELIESLSAGGGGRLVFSPGVVEFRRGINLAGIRKVELIGGPGTVFRFRDLEEWGRIRTTGSHAFSEKVVEVDRPDLVRANYRYQLFLPDLKGGRFLECHVKKVKGNLLELAWSSVTQPGVESIEAGAYVVPEINFFDSFRGGEIRFEGITFEGNVDISKVDLGGRPFYGHTTHCGIVIRNLYKAPRPRPATRGIQIERCTFRNLLGRGVAIYNVDGVRIRDCTFESIRTEGLEIDHWSLGVVISGCRFDRCGTGVQLNDCNEVAVTESFFMGNHLGLRVLDALHDRTTNHGLIVSDNVFRANNKGLLVDAAASGNSIRGNLFEDCGSVAVTLRADEVLFTGNLIRGSGQTGVEVFGKRCLIKDNLIVPPTSAGDGFQRIRNR